MNKHAIGQTLFFIRRCFIHLPVAVGVGLLQSPLLCEASLALLERTTLLFCSCSLRGCPGGSGEQGCLQAYELEARGLGNDQPL